MKIGYRTQLCTAGEPTDGIFILWRGQVAIQVPQAKDPSMASRRSKEGVEEAFAEEKLFTHEKDIEARSEGIPGGDHATRHATPLTVAISTVGPGSLIDMATEHKTRHGVEYRWACDVVAKGPSCAPRRRTSARTGALRTTPLEVS